jgi:hypothetical protein
MTPTETVRLQPACDGDHSLHRLVSAFRRGIIGTREPDMMCAAVCWPLQGYLSMLGYETEVVEADFGNVNHVWLRLPCGCIIDPTASQFSGPTLKLPKVYIGKEPEIYQRWQHRANDQALSQGGVKKGNEHE